MKLQHYDEIEARQVEADGVTGVKMRLLISQSDGASNFIMRMFEVEPNGFTPHHRHAWEHEVFVLEGEGTLITQDGEKPFRAGDVIFVAPDEEHQFKNASGQLLRFLCLIPAKKD